MCSIICIPLSLFIVSKYKKKQAALLQLPFFLVKISCTDLSRLFVEMVFQQDILDIELGTL